MAVSEGADLEGFEAVDDSERLLVVIGRLKRHRFPEASLDSESETSMAASTSSPPLVFSADSLHSGEPAKLFPDSCSSSSPLSLASELSSLSQSSFPSVSASVFCGRAPFSPPELFYHDLFRTFPPLALFCSPLSGLLLLPFFMPSPTMGSVSFQSRGVGQIGDRCPRPPHLAHLLRLGPELPPPLPTPPGPVQVRWTWMSPSGAAGVNELAVRMLSSSSTDTASRTVGTLSSCLATWLTALSVCCSGVDIFA